MQGGYDSLLTATDVTGSTPSQLAVSKGHRALGLHLADWRKQKEQGGLFGKSGPLGFLFNTSLCPFIWVYIIVMLIIFVHRVRICSACMLMLGMQRLRLTGMRMSDSHLGQQRSVGLCKLA